MRYHKAATTEPSVFIIIDLPDYYGRRQIIRQPKATQHRLAGYESMGMKSAPPYGLLQLRRPLYTSGI